jgi:long-chain acyl-CoA synthetase
MLIFFRLQIAMYMAGASVGFFGGDIRQLIDDFKALKPTVTPAVPRLLNRIHDKVSYDYGKEQVSRSSQFTKLVLEAYFGSLKHCIFVFLTGRGISEWIRYKETSFTNGT